MSTAAGKPASTHNGPSARTLGVAMAAGIAPLTWGSTFFVTDTFLPPDRPLFGAAVRALPIGLVFLLAVRQLPRGHWWWKTAVLSLLNVGAFFPLAFLAAYHLSSGLAATLTATAPFVVMGLAWVLIGERPRPAALLGAAAALIGVPVLVGGSGLRYDALGLLGSAGAITSSALGFVLVKRWAPTVGMLTLSAWQLVGGGLLLLPTALIAEGAPPAMTLPALLGYAYLSIIGTGLAFFVWFRATSHLPAGSVALIGLLNPVSGTFLGVAFDGEAFGLSRTVGLGLILSGVMLGQVHRCGKARPSVERNAMPKDATPSGRVDIDRASAPCVRC